MQAATLLRQAEPLVRNPQAVWADRREDRELAAMALGYRSHGGLVTGDELVRLMRRRSDQPISEVARWIVNREVAHFAYRGETLLPLFQFDRDTLQPTRGVMTVVRELRGAFDDWEVSLWFVTPNTSIGGAVPLHEIERDPSAVLAAARTDRFIVLG